MKKIGSFIQKNTATFPAKTVLFLVLLLCAVTTPALAQTTWTGATDTDWATPSNWSAGVPDATQIVIIPDVTNDPSIDVAAFARSVTVQSGAVLTIGAAASLTIDNVSTQGILNQGTVENSGTLNIGQTSNTGAYGIRNESIFNNNTGGQIKIDRSTLDGLYNSGAFTNAGTITIGAVTSAGLYGIRNIATFNNNTGAQINIDRTTGTNSAALCNFTGATFTNAATITIGAVTGGGLIYGIRNESTFNNNMGGQIKIDRTTGTNSASIYNFTGGTFTNAATITIGALVSSQVNFGIRNESVFNNNAGGQINIDRWTYYGLYNVTGGTFTNVATITIGALVANGGDQGIRNESAFNNNTGGLINIDRSRIWGLYNFTGGTFTNAAAITIGAVASVGNYGIWNNAAFNNNTGGQIKIDRWASAGLNNVNDGTFTNAATITIGALASTGLYGVFNESTFNNNTGGQIKIDRSTDTGLYNFTGGTFTNETTITIGAVASVGTYGLQNKAAFNNNTGGQINVDRSTSVGIYNLTGGTFTNETTLTIGAVASVGTYGIQNFATFNNNTGGQISIDRSTTSGIYLLFGASTFLNAATITIGALVPMTNLMTYSSSGTFSNITGGVLKGTGTLPAFAFIHAGGRLAPGYSPGKMTFDVAEDFSNSILDMEVASGGGAGGADFDQVVVTSGAATLGTNTTLNLVFSYAATDGATFDILTASSISGTIPSGNISFSNTGAGNVTGVSVSYPTGKVRVTVSTTSTWTGATGTDWATSSNWSAGVPNANQIAVIPNVANKPIIGAAAFAHTVTVQSGAVLTLAAAGTLTIDGSPTQGILNQGTVQNSGTLQIGQTTGTGLYGIQNSGTFNNNTGGQINIDRSTSAGLYNLAGIFTNRSTITIGAVAGVGTYGIQNSSSFNNNTGGQINIDRATTAGILLNSGAFSNTATTTIGALVPITNLMTRISGTFTNNPGGVLKGTGTLVAAAFIHLGGQLAPGYSPGKMTFDAAEDFSNSILAMEVAGGGGVGGTDFDQVVVTSGAATLGANTTLNLVFGYAVTEGTTFDILTAGSISGTIPLAKISFSNTGAGNVTGVSVSYPTGKVRVTVNTVTTWTGATGTNWATATNWSNGVPDATKIVIIPNVTNNPTISSAAIARSVTVQNGAVLTIASGATLTIDGSPAQGILNQGTVENSGTLNIGQTTDTGLYGIQSNGTFNNKTGGQIRIDRSTGTNSAGLYNVTGGTFTNAATITIGAVVANGGDYGIRNESVFNNNTGGQIKIDRSMTAGLYNNVGTFTNAAGITIGAVTVMGSYGILNQATFNNNTGSQINIDRSTAAGIYNNVGTFNNAAIITIGAVASAGQMGILNQAAFNNNTGGQINIDRSTIARVFLYNGTFTNAATITIGALVPMTNLITPGSGTFSNNTGGILKGTGTLPAAAFTNSGGELSPGYSPGKMTFDAAEDFTNSILAMEVAGGGGVAGTDFDQIVVNGAATLGGTLALSFNYPAPADGTQIMMLDATSLSGTFGLITGLPSGWTVNYDVPSAGKVSLVYTLALPVELTSFSARLSGPAVQLDWQTASEHHNAGFYIERSADGLHWSELGFVAGKGDATEAQHYSFPDETPLPSLNYYRLRQTDMDGKITFSPVVSITLEGRGAVFSVFPNPVSQGVLTLRFSEKTSTEDVEVRLFNAAGQLVKSLTINPENDPSINLSGLPPGTYLLEAKNGRVRFCEKVMKE